MTTSRHFLMAGLRAGLVGRISLPSGRFFKPRPKFWDVLDLHKLDGLRTFIDAGTGSGDLPREAKEKMLNMLGVDLFMREGQDPDVLIADAVLQPYGEHIWPVICRPSHDGFAGDVMEAALKRGANVFYAGFKKNHSCDLAGVKRKVIGYWPAVGEDREGLWLFSRR